MKQEKSDVFFYSLLNHLTISYGKDQAWLRKSNDDQWNFSIHSCSRANLDWRTELQLAAQQIKVASGGREIYLYVDGSFESQVMMQAFYWVNIDFKAVIPKFDSDQNMHAVCQAVASCEELHVPYIFESVDAEKFISSREATQWVKKYTIDQPDRLIAMKIWDAFAIKDSYLVFPFGLLQLVRQPDAWKIVQSEWQYDLFRFQKDKNLIGISCFFSWSPELTRAYLLDPLVRRIVSNLEDETKISNLVQKAIYENYFKINGVTNYHGLERLPQALKSLGDNVQKIGGVKYQFFTFNYVNLVNQLAYVPKRPTASPKKAG